MKVNISSISELLGGVVRFEGDQEIDLIKEINELGLKLLEPIHVIGQVTNTGEGFLVEANLSFKYETNCNRCLEHFEATQKTNLKEEFISGHNQDENDSVLSFNGDIIELQDCLNQQVLLSLPMKLLCKQNCQGFCADCGVNLNQESCQCVKGQIDSRFEKLNSLLTIEGGGANGKPNE